MNHWKRFSSVLISVVLVVTPLSAQETSVLELVDECDILAAHPDDTNRMAEGVADDKIVPRLAILACERAIDENPNDARFQFQIGRAFLAVNKNKEALEWFQKASQSNYGAAWAYVGDAYQFGYGTKVDTTKAHAAYKKAVATGFELAKGQIEQLQFDPNMYTGEFLNAFFQSDFKEILSKSNDSTLKPLVRNYVFNLVQTLMQGCEQFLAPESVPALYRYRYPQGWSAQADDNVSVAIQTSVSEYDAATFLKRHGCEGPVAKHVFINIDKFFRSLK